MAVIKQLELADYVLQKRMSYGHGGPRKGAGAKRVGRGQVPHRQRSHFNELTPVHVTLRVVEGLSNLRQRSLVMEVRKTFAQGVSAATFGWLNTPSSTIIFT